MYAKKESAKRALLSRGGRVTARERNEQEIRKFACDAAGRSLSRVSSTRISHCQRDRNNNHERRRAVFREISAATAVCASKTKIKREREREEPGDSPMIQALFLGPLLAAALCETVSFHYSLSFTRSVKYIE